MTELNLPSLWPPSPPAQWTCPPLVYAIEVQDGDQSVRYEAPSVEEVLRLAEAHGKPSGVRGPTPPPNPAGDPCPRQ